MCVLLSLSLCDASSDAQLSNVWSWITETNTTPSSTCNPTPTFNQSTRKPLPRLERKCWPCIDVDPFMFYQYKCLFYSSSWIPFNTKSIFGPEVDIYLKWDILYLCTLHTNLTSDIGDKCNRYIIDHEWEDKTISLVELSLAGPSWNAPPLY